MNLLHSLLDILRDSILITGLVIVMMMMIEALNIESHGRFAARLRGNRFGQVLFGAALGLVPGCIGGFATVSLYTHRLFSFGALIAMMIASSGDEAFVMLAMFPKKALILFGILFAIAIVSGLLTDFAVERIRRGRSGAKGGAGEKNGRRTAEQAADIDTEGGSADDGLEAIDGSGCGCEGFKVHGDEKMVEHDHGKRHFGWKRAVIAAGLAVFIAALGSGLLEHDHGAHHGAAETEEVSDGHCCGDKQDGHNHWHSRTDGYGETGHSHDGAGHRHDLKIDLLSESWMNVLFACLSLIMLAVIIFAPDHFIEEHLWHHIIRRHLPTIFLWTFGILAGIAVLMHFIDISGWVSGNTALMILLAVLIGIIPESGPHLIFVTLYAAGLVPFPVLLASSISQDGHASIPLLAESKKSFLWAKAINCAVALLCGYTAMLFC